jgi:hypothetical protein
MRQQTAILGETHLPANIQQTSGSSLAPVRWAILVETQTEFQAPLEPGGMRTLVPSLRPVPHSMHGVKLETGKMAVTFRNGKKYRHAAFFNY